MYETYKRFGETPHDNATNSYLKNVQVHDFVVFLILDTDSPEEVGTVSTMTMTW